LFNPERTRCDHCEQTLRYGGGVFAYRPQGLRRGPWMVEVLCRDCHAGMVECHLWTIKLARLVHTTPQSPLTSLQALEAWV